MDGGLDPELAYTLSDIYIQNVEDIMDVNKINSFMVQAMAEFADRVQKSKQNRYSRLFVWVIFLNIFMKI
jgi:hypothetical protein